MEDLDIYLNGVMVLFWYSYFSFNVPYIYIRKIRDKLRIPEYHDVSRPYDKYFEKNTLKVF